MSVSLTPDPALREVSDLGVVVPGALLLTLVSGTPSTNLATYSDGAGAVPNTNPVVASAFGLFGPIYLTAGVAYRLICKTAAGVVLWDRDPVVGGAGLVAGAGITLTTVGGVTTIAASAAGGYAPTYVAKTATYTAVAKDFVDCTANSFTVTLPGSVANPNLPIWVVNSGSGTITVGRTGTDVIGNQGETAQTLNPGDEMTFVSSGTGLWRIT
jgi:hypothetical protein